ncbi:MAG: TOBE domain-containing protein, partial [Planctomycetales bacterium]|nr:TOBE domain-containing protein [Planctomycetales bacterium]
DEPFGSLDAALRAALRESVRAIQRRLGLATVLVTHDQEEALAVADHLVVMRGGRVEQAGPPADMYRRPATRFVAEFLGGAAVLPATVAGGRVRTALGEAAASGRPDGPALAVVRPEGARIGAEGAPARVLRTTFAGGRFLVEVALAAGADGAGTVRVASEAPGVEGAEVRVSLAEPPHLLPPEGA